MNTNETMQTEKCPFCKMARHEIPAIMIYEDSVSFAIMDLYPATAGHILVLPKKHIEDVYHMPPELGGHIMAKAIAIVQAIKKQLAPDGLNLIQSNGTAAGQTIPHFHLHIVPRYRNDPVVLEFGHGSKPALHDELERIALSFKSALAI